MNLTLYVKDNRLVTQAGTVLAVPMRPLLHWGDRVDVEVRLHNGAIAEGDYYYMLDYDRDFIRRSPCQSGKATVTGGHLAFSMVLHSQRLAHWLAGRKQAAPVYLQIAQASDEAITGWLLDDAVFAQSLVADPTGSAYTFDDDSDDSPLARILRNYYTKAEIDNMVVDNGSKWTIYN